MSRDPPRLAIGVVSCVTFKFDGVLMAVVLIVEDEVFVQMNAQWTVDDLGYNALVASNSAEALAQLSLLNPIDAMFVDIRLGGEARGGYTIADHAVLARPDLRVLYTSGTPLNDDMTQQFVAGGQFLQKPYSDAQLESALAGLFEPLQT